MYFSASERRVPLCWRFCTFHVGITFCAAGFHLHVLSRNHIQLQKVPQLVKSSTSGDQKLTSGLSEVFSPRNTFFFWEVVSHFFLFQSCSENPSIEASGHDAVRSKVYHTAMSRVPRIGWRRPRSEIGAAGTWNSSPPQPANFRTLMDFWILLVFSSIFLALDFNGPLKRSLKSQWLVGH